MGYKPNPSCALPVIKNVPNIGSFLTDIQASITKRLLLPITPASIKAVTDAQKILEEIAANESLIRQYKEVADSFANIPCPLPDIIDKNA